jgi:hypothetical protein
MPSPVFTGAPQAVKGAVKAENVTLTGFSSRGAVVQQMQISFERTMNMIYEVGSNDVYYVGDRRRGQIQGSRVVAGAGSFKEMINKYGDLCNAASNTLTLKGTGCGPGAGSVEYECVGVVLTSIGATVSAQDIVVTENIGFQFVEMNYN